MRLQLLVLVVVCIIAGVAAVEPFSKLAEQLKAPKRELLTLRSAATPAVASPAPALDLQSLLLPPLPSRSAGASSDPVDQLDARIKSLENMGSQIVSGNQALVPTAKVQAEADSIVADAERQREEMVKIALAHLAALKAQASTKAAQAQQSAATDIYVHLGGSSDTPAAAASSPSAASAPAASADTASPASTPAAAADTATPASTPADAATSADASSVTPAAAPADVAPASAGAPAQVASAVLDAAVPAAIPATPAHVAPASVAPTSLASVVRLDLTPHPALHPVYTPAVLSPLKPGQSYAAPVADPTDDTPKDLLADFDINPDMATDRAVLDAAKALVGEADQAHVKAVRHLAKACATPLCTV